MSAGVRLVFQVQPDKMPGQATVVALVDLVQHEIQQVEPRDQGRWKIDVARDWPLEVVL